MAHGEVEIGIARAPEDVWKVVREFGAIDSWNPAMESCTLDGDVRTISMMGMEIRERLVSSDDASRALTYSVVGGVPLDRHEATVTVHDAGSGASRVTWAYDVAPDPMGDAMAGVYQAGLQSLKAHCEA
jgi:mxaD protein